MTNADYIKEQLARLSDRELAAIIYQCGSISTKVARIKIVEKAWRTFCKWIDVENKSTLINKDYPVYITASNKRWCIPFFKNDNRRTTEVALQVWLTMQYDKEEWEE